MQKQFKFIDLFAGIGGFRLALENVGGHCVNFSEVDKEAIKTYCENHSEPESNNLGDITKIKYLPAHDFLTAGVPCQSWSTAGKKRGFDDERGKLWNDTLYLLNQSKPKAFIFENVKGLADPRNNKSLQYILERIELAGYHAKHYVLNSADYGVPQNRIRIYIIGFLDKQYSENFQIPLPFKTKIKLADIMQDFSGTIIPNEIPNSHDYFMFDDTRDGPTAIHSWDLIPTSDHQKHICYLLLQNRRKSIYGKLDGNPLSLNHFQQLDKTIQLTDIEQLIELDILKEVEYKFSINQQDELIDDKEELLLLHAKYGVLKLDELSSSSVLKKAKVNVKKTIQALKLKNIISCDEVRYEFKNSKNLLGINGVSRIFLPRSETFPTLVASDSNDFIALENINASDSKTYKELLLDTIYSKNNFRRINKEEACLIQGFPSNFILPSERKKWAKLIGNSVSVPVIQLLAQSVVDTGCFENS